MNRAFLLYPGCTVLARYPDYEAESRRVLATIGIETRDLEAFCCCGASLAPGIWEEWACLPAYTLAQAERDGLDVLTLCGGCTNTFRRAETYLKNDSELLGKTNHALGKLGLSYSGGVRVRHLIEVLEENLSALSQKVKRRLKHRVALSPPCQVFRPSRLYGARKTRPGSMRRIAEKIGIQLIDYPLEDDCCGSTLLTVDQSMAIRAGTSKLMSAIDHGADVVCVACGNCLFLLHRYQKKMGLKRGVPIVTLSELLSRAMELSPETLATGHPAR